LRGQWRELPDPGLAVAPAFYRGRRERVVADHASVSESATT
jgi:hypothetical protein